MLNALFLALLQATAPSPTRFELPNGLRVWIQEDHRRPVALVQVTYKAGSLNELPGQTGIAHYVEHMVYRATAHVRNEDVYGYIDRIGGRYTGGTWPEVTRYAETVPSWAVESALRVTAERMCCALFDSTEFERERHNVVTEANGFSDTDPASVMHDATMYAAFDVHPYRLNSNSWARDNLVLTRNQAYDWYRQHYGPNNAVLVIVGDVNADTIRALVERHFMAIPRAPVTGRIDVVEPPQRAEKRATVRAPGVRPEVSIVYRAPSVREPDFAAMTVVTRILRARLPGALRRAGAGGDALVEDSASQYPYVLRVTLHVDSATQVDRAVAAVDSEIARLAAADISPAELDAARAPSPRADTGATAGTSGAVPPRRSYLTRIADELTDRETLPWEVSVAEAQIARARAAGITVADVASYARRRLRPSQRTIGELRPGPDDFASSWSDARALAGDRMEVPPLITPPAKRLRPEPVPERALQPLAPTSLHRTRRAAGGDIVRSAAVPGQSAPYIRLSCECADTARLARAEQLLRADKTLRRMNAVIVAPRARAADSSAETVARSLALRHVRGERPALEDRLIAAIVAGTDHVDVENRVAELLARVSRSPRQSPLAVPPADAGEERVAVAGATQVAVVGALPGVPRDHPDRRALELLSYIVGVPSYGGRMGWALTKSGLTYAAAATNEFGVRDGAILLSTECDTRNTEATVQAIREIVDGIAARGVEEWELREAQAFMLGRATLYGPREDSDRDLIATALIQNEHGALDLDPPALSRAYLSVTLDDINRVARRYYRPDRLHIVVAGALPATHERIFPPGTFRALFEP